MTGRSKSFCRNFLTRSEMTAHLCCKSAKISLHPSGSGCCQSCAERWSRKIRQQNGENVMIRVNDVRPTDADLNEYRERGYWITPKLLPDDQIEQLRKEVNRIFEYDYDRDIYPFDRVYVYDLKSPELRKVNNGWWLNDNIRSLVLSPNLGALVAPFMETNEVRVWHDQVVVKPG